MKNHSFGACGLAPKSDLDSKEAQQLSHDESTCVRAAVVEFHPVSSSISISVALSMTRIVLKVDHQLM